MRASQSIQRTPLPNKQTPQRLEPVRPSLPEPLQAEETLLLVMSAGLFQLNRPLQAVLDTGESLLTQTDPSNPLAADLSKIVKETRLMSEIIRGLRLIL